MHALHARSLLIFAALALHLVLPLGASAQFTTEDDARALRLYQSGEVAFGEDQFEAALILFQEAHALSGRAGLLYNMAVCADRLHQEDEALRYFDRYLTEAPETAPNRAEALQRRDALTATRDAREAGGTPAIGSTPATEVPVAAHDVTQEAWFWAVLGTGAALVIGGVIVGVVLGTHDPYMRGSDGQIITALTGRF